MLWGIFITICLEIACHALCLSKMFVYNSAGNIILGRQEFMSKNQKIEWITTGVFIVVFVSLMFAVIQNYDAWGNSPVSASEVILMVAVIITGAVWLINYYVKTILALKRRTEPRFVGFVWLLGPLVITAAASFLPKVLRNNGNGSGLTGFLSVAGIFLMVVLIVFYFYMFFGKRTMWVSLVLYCLAAFVFALVREDMEHMHYFYLTCFLPFVVIGYLEMFIRNKRLARSK